MIGRIVFVSHSGDKTGAPLALSRLYRQAIEEKREDAFLVFRYHGNLVNKCREEFGGDRVFSIRRISPRDIPSLLKPLSKLVDFFLLVRLFKSLKPFVVVANSLINTTTIAAGIWNRSKVIVWAHEVSGSINDPFHFRRFWIRRTHAGIGVSRQSCDFLFELGLPWSRIHLIYNGIDPEPLIPGQSRPIKNDSGESIRLGALAIWSPNKRLDLVIETGIKVAESGKFSLVRLDIGGPPDPWFPDLFNQMESRFGKRPDNLNLQFLGPIDDLKGFYHSLDAVLMTSDKESLPTVVLEALMYLVPVFSFRDLPGVREILGELALISEERDGAGLAAEIIRFFKNPDPFMTLESWRKAARERSLLFSLEKQWKVFEQLIVNLK